MATTSTPVTATGSDWPGRLRLRAAMRSLTSA